MLTFEEKETKRLKPIFDLIHDRVAETCPVGYKSSVPYEMVKGMLRIKIKKGEEHLDIINRQDFIRLSIYQWTYGIPKLHGFSFRMVF